MSLNLRFWFLLWSENVPCATDGFKRQVKRLLYTLFESGSDCERLLLIQTPLSYKLNPTSLETPTLQNGMMVEVIGVTRQLHTVEKSWGGNMLLSVVDETLKQVFKEAGTKVIYSYIENKCHLKREEIAEKPEIFSTGLERLLSSGAPVIEKMILKNLYSKHELEFEEKEGYEFSDYIEELKEKHGC